MDLTIGNNYSYFTNEAIKNNCLKSQQKSSNFNTILAKSQEKSSESSIETSHYYPDGKIVIDDKNKTAYFNGIKMDTKFFDILEKPGCNFDKIMALEKTDESILEKIIKSNIE